ncbi:uncharacterized protein LOC119369496 [Jatropha curcas]|uniref:uncharacterized protein LOC119369496 n=1 Tax=Jatropha curcas TaxID=180498 RepID=UPI001893C229|nr:uncharacterized protein LOC119369496 [Jatropha curcas]
MRNTLVAILFVDLRLLNRSLLVETLVHLFVDYPFARSCWSVSSVGHRTASSGNFIDWFSSLLGQLNNDLSKEFAMILWSLWEARNAAVWKGVFQDQWHVKRKAGSVLNDWERAQTVVQRTHQPAQLVQWSRPPEGTLKINVDGACFSTGYAGVGYVARDCNGAFIGAFQKSFSGALEPRFVELLAIHEALSWIKREGWHLVMVESDALDCVRAVLDSNYVDDSSFGLFVIDCKSLLS